MLHLLMLARSMQGRKAINSMKYKSKQLSSYLSSLGLVTGVTDMVVGHSVSGIASSLLASYFQSLLGKSQTSPKHDAVDALERAMIDIETSLKSIAILRETAVASRTEIDNLTSQINNLEEAREAAETMLQVPQDQVTVMITKGLQRGRARGWVEGVFFGVISSLIGASIWYYAT